MKQLITTAITLFCFIANTNAQTKTKLPFVGVKEFFDEANKITFIVQIKKDASCKINSEVDGIDNEGPVEYLGIFKNKMVGENYGFLIEGDFLFLLSEHGNKRKDCLKMIKKKPINCNCKFNLKTTKLE